MEKTIEFMAKYGILLSPAIAILIGILIPKKKVFNFVKKITVKFPLTTKKKVAEYLNVVEQALINDTYNGDVSIVSNSQVSDRINKTKIEMGLEGLKSKVRE